MKPESTPQISPATRRIERDLALLVRALEALYRKRKYPLDRAQYLLLLLLIDAPRTVGELASGLGLDQSTATRQVNSLERAGLVSRSPNPHDGRSMMISATPTGKARCAQMQGVRLDRLEQLLRDWPECDRLRFADQVAALIEGLLDAPDGAQADALLPRKTS